MCAYVVHHGQILGLFVINVYGAVVIVW